MNENIDAKKEINGKKNLERMEKVTRGNSILLTGVAM